MQENPTRMLRTSIVWSSLLFGLCGQSFGQILPNSHDRKHMGPTGKPCLALHGSARAQTINPRIVEHVVSATNSCTMNIKVKVCYSGRTECITMNVPAYGKTETVLGIYPSSVLFDKFDAKELF